MYYEKRNLDEKYCKLLIGLKKEEEENIKNLLTLHEDFVEIFGALFSKLEGEGKEELEKAYSTFQTLLDEESRRCWRAKAKLWEDYGE
jgi:hypothetical protein